MKFLKILNINFSKVKYNLNKTANTYEKYENFFKKIESNLLKNLIFFNYKPNNILNLGANTGNFTLEMYKKFSIEKIFNLDLSEKRLKIAKKKNIQNILVSYSHKMPFPKESLDMIVSNLHIHWYNSNLKELFVEIYSLLKNHGLFLFSSFGPKTLQELKLAWDKIDNYIHIHPMVGICDIGNILSNIGYKNIVINTEKYKIYYLHPKYLLKDIKALGLTNCIKFSFSKFYTPNQLLKFYQSYPKNKLIDSPYTATIEVIYGIGWKKIQDVKNQKKYINIANIIK